MFILKQIFTRIALLKEVADDSSSFDEQAVCHERFGDRTMDSGSIRPLQTALLLFQSIETKEDIISVADSVPRRADSPRWRLVHARSGASSQHRRLGVQAGALWNRPQFRTCKPQIWLGRSPPEPISWG